MAEIELYRIVGLWLALAMLVASGTASAQPGPIEPRRLALVIGNIDYQNYDKLPNVANDVTEMTIALKSLQFDVVAPPERRTMSELVTADILPFADMIQEGDIVIIYYSGHGFSYGGESYLVPTGAPATVRASKVYTTFPPISAIQSLIEEQKPGLIMMIFDACRTIGSFVEPDPVTGTSKGFGVALTPPSNIWLAYGSSPGLPAGSGVAGDKSVFTRALVKNIATPGKELAEVQRMIRFDVQTATGSSQKPWYSDSRTVNLWLVPTDIERAEERKQWEAHLALGTVDAMREFLAFYGVGAYAAAARAWIAEALDDAAVATGSSPTSVPAVVAETAWRPGQANVRVARFGSLALPAATDVSTTASLETLRGAIARDALAFESAAATRRAVTISKTAPLAARQIDPTQNPWDEDYDNIIVTGSSILPAGPRKLDKGSTLRLGKSQGLLRVASTGLDTYIEDVAFKLKPTTVSLGRPTVEALVGADASGAGTTVDPAALAAALAQAQVDGRTVSWVSIATARGDSARETLALRMLGTHARLAVTEAGVPATQVTLVSGMPETFNGVRLRIYTK